jgi:hypothetical protein
MRRGRVGRVLPGDHVGMRLARRAGESSGSTPSRSTISPSEHGSHRLGGAASTGTATVTCSGCIAGR